MRPKPSRKILKKLTIALVSVSIAIIISELSLRMLYPIRYYVWLPNAHFNCKLVPGILPGIEGEWSLLANSQGIRGSEFPRDQSYKILTIGGSTTECLLLRKFAVLCIKLPGAFGLAVFPFSAIPNVSVPIPPGPDTISISVFNYFIALTFRTIFVWFCVYFWFWTHSISV